MAERLGLNHDSQGVGRQRFIVVSKPFGAEGAVSEMTESPLRKMAQDLPSDVKKDLHPIVYTEYQPSHVGCETCSKDIPVENLKLHRLRCRVAKTKLVEHKDVKPKSTKPSKKSKKSNRIEKKEEEGEDFDTIISKAMKENSTCAFNKCKTPDNYFWAKL